MEALILGLCLLISLEECFFVFSLKKKSVLMGHKGENCVFVF
jgi:hypothetical protein